MSKNIEWGSSECKEAQAPRVMNVSSSKMVFILKNSLLSGYASMSKSEMIPVKLNSALTDDQ